MDTDIKDLPEVTAQEEKVLTFEVRARGAAEGARGLRQRAQELNPLLSALAEDLQKLIAKPPAPVGGIEARYGVNERNQRLHERQVAELKQLLSTGRAELRLVRAAADEASALATSLNTTATSVRQAFERKRTEERLAAARAEPPIEVADLHEREVLERDAATMTIPTNEANNAATLAKIERQAGGKLWGRTPSMHGGYRLPPPRR